MFICLHNYICNLFRVGCYFTDLPDHTSGTTPRMSSSGNESVLKSRLVEFCSPTKPSVANKRSILSPRLKEFNKKKLDSDVSVSQVSADTSDERTALEEDDRFLNRVGNSDTSPFAPVNYKAPNTMMSGANFKHGKVQSNSASSTAVSGTIAGQKVDNVKNIQNGVSLMPALTVRGGCQQGSGNGSRVAHTGAGAVPNHNHNHNQMKLGRITAVTATSSLLPATSATATAETKRATEGVEQPTCAAATTTVGNVGLNFTDSAPPTAPATRAPTAKTGPTHPHTPHSHTYVRRSPSPVQSVADGSALEQLTSMYAATLLEPARVGQVATGSPISTPPMRSVSPTGTEMGGHVLEIGFSTLSESSGVLPLGLGSSIDDSNATLNVKKPNFIGYNTLKSGQPMAGGEFVGFVSAFNRSTVGPPGSGVDAGQSRHAVSCTVSVPCPPPLMPGLGPVDQVESPGAIGKGITLTSKQHQALPQPSGATLSMTPGADKMSGGPMLFRGHPNELLLDPNLCLSAHTRKELLSYRQVFYYDISINHAAMGSASGVRVRDSSSVGHGREGEGDEFVNNYGFDDVNGHYKVNCCESKGAYVQDVEASHTDSHIDYRYQLCQYIGAGTFAKIYRAIDHKVLGKTSKVVGIKINRNIPGIHRQAAEECAVLYHIQQYVADTVVRNKAICRLLNSFEFRSHYCLVFPLYGMNLQEYMQLLNTLYMCVD